MSKDWRPVDLYQADRIFAQKGEPLREIKWVMKIKGEEDETISLTNENAKEKYPELSFLMSDFKNVFEKYENNKTANKVFSKFEKALVQAENDIEKGMEENFELYDLTEKEFYKQPVSAVVQEWFHGRLDESFYYSDRNNKIMHDFLEFKVKEALMRIRKNEIER